MTSKDIVNSVAVIGLLGTIALESFVLGRMKIIDIIIKDNLPILYSSIDVILIIIMIGFFSFFLLGVITLHFSEDDE